MIKPDPVWHYFESAESSLEGADFIIFISICPVKMSFGSDYGPQLTGASKCFGYLAR